MTMMTARRFLPWAGLLAAALTACAAFPEGAEAPFPGDISGSISEDIPTGISEEISEPYLPEKRLRCNYFDRRSFDMQISAAERYEAEGKLLCGTVPHHLTAGRMAAGFFAAAAESRDKTDTVVIVATLHEPEGEPLVTSRLGWDTPLGTADNDGDITGAFIEMGAAEDDGIMERDHSAAGIIPFVKQYFPEAKISCLLAARTAAADCPEKIAKVLTRAAEDKDCLIVFSVDFSHYLPPWEAELRDDETIGAVLSGDCSAIAAMNGSSDNVDSARCLEAFVRLSGETGGDIRLMGRGTTADMTGLPYNSANFPQGVTSYLVFGTEK